MNRQVIPSMILSVLIVCFFSVLLYDRDKRQSADEQHRAERKSESGPVAPAAQDKPASPAVAPSSAETATAPPSQPAAPAVESPSPKANEPQPGPPPTASGPPSSTDSAASAKPRRCMSRPKPRFRPPLWHLRSRGRRSRPPGTENHSTTWPSASTARPTRSTPSGGPIATCSSAATPL